MPRVLIPHAPLVLIPSRARESAAVSRDVRPQGRRSRVTAALVGFLLALSAVFASAGPAAAQDKDSGRVGVISRLLIDQISKATGLTFAARSVTGDLLSTITLRGVTVRDKKGLFATVGLIRLDWTPTSLFSRNVRVDSLLIRDVVLKRAPAKPPANAAPLDLSFLKLDVGQPVDIRFEKLKIENVVLEKAVFGRAGRFDVEGRLIAPRDRQKLDLDLRIVRKGGTAPEGHVVARLHSDGKARRLKVDVDLKDPESGLVGGLLGLPPTDALALTIKGDAPMRDWHGRFDLTAGRSGDLKLDIGVKTDAKVTRATITGRGGSALIGRQFAGLGTDVSIRLVAAYGDRIAVETLAIDSPKASLKGSGWIEPATNRFSLDLDARLDDFAAIEPLVGFPLRGKGRVKAALRGQASRPTVQLDVAADALRLSRLSAKKASLTLRLDPIAGSTQPSARRLALDLTTADAWLARDDGGQDRLDALALKLTGDVDLEKNTARDVKLAASVGAAKLTAAGNLDRLTPIKADGRIALTGTLPDALLPGRLLRDAKLTGSLSLDQALKKLAVDVNGEAASLKTGVGWVDALVAGAVKFRVDATRDGDRIDLKALDVKTANVSIVGDGRLAPNDPKGIQLKARVDQLAPVGQAIGQTLAGSLALDATVRQQGAAVALKGRLDGTSITVGRVRLGTVSATVDAGDVTRAPQATFALRLTGGDLTGRLSARLRSTDKAIALDDIDGRLNAGRDPRRDHLARRRADRQGPADARSAQARPVARPRRDARQRPRAGHGVAGRPQRPAGRRRRSQRLSPRHSLERVAL